MGETVKILSIRDSGENFNGKPIFIIKLEGETVERKGFGNFYSQLQAGQTIETTITAKGNLSQTKIIDYAGKNPPTEGGSSTKARSPEDKIDIIAQVCIKCACEVVATRPYDDTNLPAIAEDITALSKAFAYSFEETVESLKRIRGLKPLI